MNSRDRLLFRLTAVGLMLVVLSGCFEARDRADKFRFVGTNQAARIAKQTDIEEAVFRYQMEHLKPAELADITVCFLSINNADPPNEILLRLKDAKLPVYPYSTATCDQTGCYFDKEGRRGVGLNVWEMRWMGNDKVQVKGSFHKAGLWGAGYKYTLIFGNGKWRVVGCSGQWIS